mmetsp:Transcript_44649/g.104848  ORF Transcript_44649/g.104848 Transcript_44649/m.104848 type:complete len:355 (+) Transcript_44649:65-1129(+)
MKALLTQLYFIPEFRALMLDWFNSDDPSSKVGLVGEMRAFFAYMQQLENYNGSVVRTTENTDANEYFCMLLDELKDKLKTTAMSSLVKECFMGGETSQIICRKEVTVGGRVYPVDDPFKSECQQEFYSLRVDIAGMKTLGDALAGYVRGEMLDGEDKFPLDGGVEVVAEKRVCLAMSQLPRTLFVQLQRYSLDFMTMTHVKLNDRCEFPMRLNVEPYTAEGLDRREQARRQNVSVAEWDLPTDCEYELIGAIVHRGTAHHGSYYSYVKNRGGGAAGEGPTRWEVHQEGKSEPFNVDQIEEACFGGDGKDYCAYVLVYRRVSAPEELELERQMESLDVSEREGGLEQSLGNLSLA